MTAVALRFGRNLQSLESTSDITDRAARICPLCARLGANPTYLGNSRWKVTGNSSGALTLADPAGKAPPVKFDDQFNNATGETWYIYRESTAQAYAITDATASPSTVTISGDPGIAVGEFVQFRRSATSGNPIAHGTAGPLPSLSRGYVLPLLAIGKASNVLTVSHLLSTPAQPTADGQYVGDDVAFSNFVQTSIGDLSPHELQPPYGWPSYTLIQTGGTDFSALAPGDWLITGDLSVWENGGGLGTSLPPMTVTAITDATHIEVTLRGTGPVFNTGVIPSISLQFFRPVAANPDGVVTASSASAHTVTVDDATGLTATTGAPCALELSYTPMAGEIPYYLDHPVYIDPSNVGGIGVKFGTIDRGDTIAVANLCPNAWARNWTAGVPDGYTATGATMTQTTDPLFTELGGSSILVTPTVSNWQFRTPVFPWRAPAPGQRFSFRAHLMWPERWSGSFMVSMRFGFVTASGQIVTWNRPDPVHMVVPPDYPGSVPSDWGKPQSGAWYDAALVGFDITAARDLAVQQIGPQNAVGFFVAMCGELGGVTPPFIFDGIAIVAASDVPSDLKTFGEFGQANAVWQDVNVALGLIGKPLPTIAVDLLDLYRGNPDAAEEIDKLALSGDLLVHAPECGWVNERQRIINLVQDQKYPRRSRIIVGNPLGRYTDFFIKRTQAVQSAATSATTALQSGTPSSGGSPGGSTGGPGGTGGGTSPAITLTVTLDATTNVPTAVVTAPSTIQRVKIAGRTDRYPTLDEIRAESSINAPAVFTRDFAAIDLGVTQYGAAVGYDAAGTESAPAQASVTRGSATVATRTPWLFARRGQGLWQDRAGTIAAGDTDPVDRWDDSLGSGRYLFSHDGGASGLDGTGWAGSLDYRPVVDAASQSLLFAPIVSDTGNQLRLPSTSNSDVLDELFILVGIKLDADPPSDSSHASGLFESRSGIGPSLYPDTDGHVKTSFGLTGYHDLGDPGDLSDGFHAYGEGGSKTTGAHGQLAANFDGVDLLRYDLGGAEGFVWGAHSGNSDGVAIGSGILTGKITDVVVFDALPTADEIAAWTPYLTGDTDTAPTEVSSVALSYVRSGGDVIVTADARFASSAKIDASTSGTPTDATVRATSDIGTRPFQKSFPAPTSVQTLHVKAFAYFDALGGLESAAATLDIPFTPDAADGDSEFILAASDADLPNARVATDTPTVAWDFATSGQAKADVPDASLGVEKLSATGTPDATTFLRGDNTWAAPAGSPALDDLTDVDAPSPSDGDVLTFNNGSGNWEAAAPTGGSSPSETTVTVTTASLANAAEETGTVALGKTGVVSAITVDRACRVRLYQTSADRTADASRALGTPPPETTDLLAEWAFAASGSLRRIPVLVRNGDGSRTSDIYYAIANLSGATHTVQVDFFNTVLET